MEDNLNKINSVKIDYKLPTTKEEAKEYLMKHNPEVISIIQTDAEIQALVYLLTAKNILTIEEYKDARAKWEALGWDKTAQTFLDTIEEMKKKLEEK